MKLMIRFCGFMFLAAQLIFLSACTDGDAAGCLSPDNSQLPGEDAGNIRKRPIGEFKVVDDDGGKGLPGGPKDPDIDPLDLNFNHNIKVNPWKGNSSQSGENGELPAYPAFGEQ